VKFIVETEPVEVQQPVTTQIETTSAKPEPVSNPEAQILPKSPELEKFDLVLSPKLLQKDPDLVEVENFDIIGNFVDKLFSEAEKQASQEVSTCCAKNLGENQQKPVCEEVCPKNIANKPESDQIINCDNKSAAMYKAYQEAGNTGEFFQPPSDIVRSSTPTQGFNGSSMVRNNINNYNGHNQLGQQDFNQVKHQQQVFESNDQQVCVFSPTVC